MFAFGTMLLYIRPLIDDAKIYAIVGTMQYILAVWLIYCLSGRNSPSRIFKLEFVKVKAILRFSRLELQMCKLGLKNRLHFSDISKAALESLNF